MNTNTKDKVLVNLNDAIESLKKARDAVVESNEVDNVIISAWEGVKNYLGITDEKPNKEAVVEKVEKKVDAAVDATADKIVDAATEVVEKKAEEVKATTNDTSDAKTVVTKVKDEAVKEIKEKVEAKKAEVKIEEKTKKA